ncbi:hypothetical protein [Streptacidiphilus neutrinimicus]|uniref:hypothetical protein n=1 Tax=Streptacidiphilus neutrinimicus TaxID=105420 RepID=UPI001269B61A|nr:hypothetical protein [Streptacidiphilus neutrinimicus]
MRVAYERVGDPRFPQRVRLPDGSVQVVLPKGSVPPQFTEAVERLRTDFREHFGRDPQPGEPLLFDHAASEPTPLDERDMEAMVADLAGSAKAAGLDPAYLLAVNDVGYMVTEDTQHLFTAHEVQAYLDAVERHQAAQARRASAELHRQVEHALRTAVSAVVSSATDTPAITVLRYLDTVADEQGEDAAGQGYAYAFGTLASWLVGAAEGGLPPEGAEQAVHWVAEHLGEMNGRSALETAGMLRHPAAPTTTVDELVETLGDRGVVVALTWLTAGLVATAGQGHADWLPPVADARG